MEKEFLYKHFIFRNIDVQKNGEEGEKIIIHDRHRSFVNEAIRALSRYSFQQLKQSGVFGIAKRGRYSYIIVERERYHKYLNYLAHRYPNIGKYEAAKSKKEKIVKQPNQKETFVEAIHNDRYCFVLPKGKAEDLRVSYMSEVFNALGWGGLEVLCKRFPEYFSMTTKSGKKYFKITEKFRRLKELRKVLEKVNRLDIYEDIVKKYFPSHPMLTSETSTVEKDSKEKLIISNVKKREDKKDSIVFESRNSERDKVSKFNDNKNGNNEKLTNLDLNKKFSVNNSIPNRLINEPERNLQRGVEILGSIQPTRTQRTVVEVGRSQSLSQNLKKLYKHHCQLCGQRVQVGVSEYASESHHVQPVGGKHGGPDIAENIIIVCPNHHLMFDRGAVTIDLKQKKVIHVDVENSIHNTSLILKHYLQEQYIEYHNQYIFKGIIKENSFSQAVPQKGNMNYGKTVTVCDTDGEQYVFQLEDFSNKHLLGGMEKLLIGVDINAEINFNGFRYRIIDIK